MSSGWFSVAGGILVGCGIYRLDFGLFLAGAAIVVASWKS